MTSTLEWLASIMTGEITAAKLEDIDQRVDSVPGTAAVRILLAELDTHRGLLRTMKDFGECSRQMTNTEKAPNRIQAHKQSSEQDLMAHLLRGSKEPRLSIRPQLALLTAKSSHLQDHFLFRLRQVREKIPPPLCPGGSACLSGG